MKPVRDTNSEPGSPVVKFAYDSRNLSNRDLGDTKSLI